MGRKTEVGSAAREEPSEQVGGLFGTSAKVDPTLASLFASKPTSQPAPKARADVKSKHVVSKKSQEPEQSSSDSEDDNEASSDNESGASSSNDDDEVSGSDSSEAKEDAESVSEVEEDEEADPVQAPALADTPEEGATKGRRKRKRNDEDIEDKYMERLAKEEAREEAQRKKERSSKRQKSTEAPAETNDTSSTTKDGEGDEDSDVEMDDGKSSADEDDDESDFEVPQHESISNNPATEVEKANRTVFLGNVSSSAVTDKSAKKTLIQHISAILSNLAMSKDGETQHKVESIRFRSTAYTNMLPKKASFVTQDLMESTTHATNAYVVLSTKVAAREALKLNGTLVLGRHLRVDSVAHPAKTDHRRCVFVGNLGFVDDESAVLAAEAKEGKDGKKKKPRKKVPSDIEEGLWREFGKCGTVENVRVVRDSKTRVGKGIAYVQFTDENAVEAALLYDGKKFPPMLPRNLRVSRAKGMKRNAPKKDHGARPSSNGVYNPKVSEEQKSALGRASKLLGRAGAALQTRTNPVNANATPLSRTRLPPGGKAGEVKAPESFVFEGHRATPGGFSAGKGRKKGGNDGKKKIGRPDNRSARRAKAWKLGGEK